MTVREFTEQLAELLPAFTQNIENIKKIPTQQTALEWYEMLGAWAEITTDVPEEFKYIRE